MQIIDEPGEEEPEDIEDELCNVDIVGDGCCHDETSVGRKANRQNRLGRNAMTALGRVRAVKRGTDHW
jgi:hypothetical protein